MFTLISPSVLLSRTSLRMNVRCMCFNTDRGVNTKGVSPLSSTGADTREEAGREVGCNRKRGGASLNRELSMQTRFITTRSRVCHTYVRMQLRTKHCMKVCVYLYLLHVLSEIMDSQQYDCYLRMYVHTYARTYNCSSTEVLATRRGSKLIGNEQLSLHNSLSTRHTFLD